MPIAVCYCCDLFDFFSEEDVGKMETVLSLENRVMFSF